MRGMSARLTVLIGAGEAYRSKLPMCLIVVRLQQSAFWCRSIVQWICFFFFQKKSG